jgi:hydroxyquinol 1,2-dioxygenase
MTIEHTITQDVIDRLKSCEDPRLKAMVVSLVRHLHDFVRDIRPTDEEWFSAIRFLTETGQICDDKRQEYILLSDILGVSMLVDAINHEPSAGATESTVLGPFYVPSSRELPMGASIALLAAEGERVKVRGQIRSASGAPVAGAELHVWQTAENGMYDVQDRDQPEGNMRGRFRTGEGGAYALETVCPTSYAIPSDGPVGLLLRATGRHPYRPAHIHFMILAPGHARLITHLFIAGDQYLDSDAVFGVKPSLIVTPRRSGDERFIEHDFVLSPR